MNRARIRGGIVAACVAALTIALSACSSTAGTQAAASAAGATAPTCSTTAPRSSDPAVAASQERLVKAASPATAWDGPTTGPKAQKPGASMVFIPYTSSNAGDVGVGTGFQEAAKALGWNVKVIDGGGSVPSYLAAFDQAMALRPAGIVVSSFDPNASEPSFAKAKAAGIPVVGNHTGEGPGPQTSAPSLFTNVTSDPATIAQTAADCAIVASNGTAGVTIVGCGSELQICVTKEKSMNDTIKTCSKCAVLDQHDYPFGEATQRQGQIASADLQRFGPKLTHMLSINDVYWDSAIPAVKAAGIGPSGPPLMIAAGDGSPAAFQRIRTNQYQIATVAEPLNEHGWQMADEMNRALAGQAPSTYVTYPHIVTRENVDAEGGKDNLYDPGNSYRDRFTAIWK